MTSITKVVGDQKSLTTMKKALAASGLTELLGGKDVFTIFAPSDIAFNKLTSGTIEELLKPENKSKLVDLLKHHIVSGKVEFKNLKAGDKLKSIDGKELNVKLDDGKISIEGAIIQARDVKTTNGTIHMLDKVLLN